MSKQPPTWIRDALATADIQINGSRPWDITVHNPAFYDRLLAQGSLGMGQAYMEGWWDCQALDEFFFRVFQADLSKNLHLSWPMAMTLMRAKFFNLQSPARAFQVGQRHYDLGNSFFEKMLGPSMVYSCAYFKDTDNLDDAQTAKLDLICRKLNLQKGPASSAGRQQIRILDIGSGWGAFAKYAAQKYGVSVVGVTVSKEQAEYARAMCKGLPVEFRLQDYRTLNEKFDHIVSVGMFEHVGVKNYRTYLEVARRCLKKDGLFLLHTIGSLSLAGGNDPWLNKYIFPNGSLPSLAQITKAATSLFVIEDVHNFGTYYDKTLMAWNENFEKHWPQYKDKYGQTFYRMWRYYLLVCAGLFRSRTAQLWQIVLSPEGVKGGYESVR